MAKIPCLVLADGFALYNSRVICEYLDTLHGGPRMFPPEGPARWAALQLQSLADGITDAALLARYESFLRPEPQRWPAWIDGQLDKVTRGLDRIEAVEASSFGERLDIGVITVACAVGYLDFRFPGMAWRTTRPALAAWYDAVCHPTVDAGDEATGLKLSLRPRRAGQACRGHRLSSNQVNNSVGGALQPAEEREIGVGGDTGIEIGAEDLRPSAVQMNFRMIRRGMGLPCASCRRPSSIGWAIKVLISKTSPGLTVPGSFTRGSPIAWTMAAQPQPPTATFTIARPTNSEPSLISAVATTGSVCARRIRVETSARPLAGVRWNTTTVGSGLASATMVMVRTWSASVIGLSTRDRQRHDAAVLGNLRHGKRHPAAVHRRGAAERVQQLRRRYGRCR